MNKKNTSIIIILFTIMIFVNYIGLYLTNDFLKKIICLIAFLLISKMVMVNRSKLQILLCLLTAIWIAFSNNYTHIIAIIGISLVFMFNDYNRFQGLIIEGLICGAITIIYENSKVAFHLCNRISYFVTSCLNGGTPLGVSISAIVEVILLVICNIIMICKLEKKGKRIKLFWLTAMFLVIYGGYINIITIALVRVPEIGTNLLFLIGLLMIIYNCITQISYIDASVNSQKKINDKLIQKKYIISNFFMCVISIIGILFVPILSEENNKNRITIVNNGVMVDVQETTNDLDKNKLGYGIRDNMFSSLPRFLQMNGYNIDIVRSIDDIKWNDTETVIFINYNKIINKREKTIIKNFTLEGGAIFVFADHTNMNGIMDAANSIMDFTDLRIRNDISDPFLHAEGKDWSNSLKFFNSYSTYNLNSNNEIQVWGGASIENNIFVEPIIIGKYGFSDERDKYNDGVGGFLGNRIYDNCELGGNTILAAKQEIGKGKVYAFGDTSYIQIPALFFNSKFMSRIFYEAMGEELFSIYNLKGCAVVIFIIAIIWSLINSQIRKFGLRGLYIGLFIGVIINSSISKTNDSKIIDRQSNNRTAVDYSLAEDFDIKMLNEKSIAGGIYNIYKNSQFPVITENWEETIESMHSAEPSGC